MLKNGVEPRLTAPKHTTHSSEKESKSILEICSGRIKEIRKQRGLTQQDVADAIFVSLDTIKRYESGTYSGISIIVLNSIAEVLNVPVWVLLKEPEQPNDLRQGLLDAQIAIQSALEIIEKVK